jgi:cytochrome c oxidase subunit 4
MTEHEKPFQGPAPENPPAEHAARNVHGNITYGPDSPSPGHEYHDDHGGNAKYVKVFLALCVLTTMSFFTYSDAWPFHDTPAVGWAFMMCVSCCKALLVMLFFMHLKYEADWKYVLTIPASIMSVFLALALVPDIGMRVAGFYTYSPHRNEFAATKDDTSILEKASKDASDHVSPDGSAQGGH